mgnify:CR=1 FL=1|jgi:hypothetical protein
MYIDGKTHKLPNIKYTINSNIQLLKIQVSLNFCKKVIITKIYINVRTRNTIILSIFFNLIIK